MSESLNRLVDELSVAIDDLRGAVEARAWRLGTDASRAGLSALSKLNSRLRVLDELAAEAGFAAAEVDRALARARHADAQIPGQTTIAEQLESMKTKSRSRKPKASS